MKGYKTTGETAAMLGISAARVRRMILDGVIKNVEKVGRDNLIPDREVSRVKSLERPSGRPPRTK